LPAAPFGPDFAGGALGLVGAEDAAGPTSAAAGAGDAAGFEDE